MFCRCFCIIATNCGILLKNIFLKQKRLLYRQHETFVTPIRKPFLLPNPAACRKHTARFWLYKPGMKVLKNLQNVKVYLNIRASARKEICSFLNINKVFERVKNTVWNAVRLLHGHFDRLNDRFLILPCLSRYRIAVSCLTLDLNIFTGEKMHCKHILFIEDITKIVYNIILIIGLHKRHEWKTIQVFL